MLHRHVRQRTSNICPPLDSSRTLPVWRNTYAHAFQELIRMTIPVDRAGEAASICGAGSNDPHLYVETSPRSSSSSSSSSSAAFPTTPAQPRAGIRRMQTNPTPIPTPTPIIMPTPRSWSLLLDVTSSQLTTQYRQREPHASCARRSSEENTKETWKIR
jgi:hypothetical protein